MVGRCGLLPGPRFSSLAFSRFGVSATEQPRFRSRRWIQAELPIFHGILPVRMYGRAAVTADPGQFYDLPAAASPYLLAYDMLPLTFADPASISATTSSIDHSRLSIPAAIAGEVRSVLWMRTKLYQRAYSATMYS